MRLKRMALISIIGFFAIVLSIIVGSMYDHTQKTKILSQMDTRLNSFDDAEAIANESKDLITIGNESDYANAESEFHKIMTTDLFNEYFPTSLYQGSEKPFTLIENSITGESIGNSAFIFKLDMTLVNGSSQTPLVQFVYIDNGLIYRIQTIG